jgi:hypothetical protein
MLCMLLHTPERTCPVPLSPTLRFFVLLTVCCRLMTPNPTHQASPRCSTGEPRALGAGTENLAAACGGEPAVPGGPPSWQLLNAAYGLLELAPAAAAGELTPSTHDGSAHAAALALLGKTVSLMYKEASAGGPYRCALVRSLG